MGIAALVVCGSVNATSWRVCSKPEAGANFLSVAEAVASNNVFAGDTLYVEPGHTEMSSVNISKKLHLIGPGFMFAENNISSMNPEEATFIDQVYFQQTGSSVSGCVFLNTTSFASSNTIKHNKFTGSINLGDDDLFSGNIVINADVRAGSSNDNIIVENNIVFGSLSNNNYSPAWNDCTIRNNTFIKNAAQDPIIKSVSNCAIYNNIVINTSTEFRTTTNSDQTVDTTWYRDFVIDAAASNGNDVYNNVLSCKANAEFRNCVFNAKVEDVLIWNGANTLEEKYKHKANGPAVGAGVNGTTCGAYGAVNGSQAYQPAGIPKYRPYIYDANIDETPSTNNTINASFKIKVQQ